MKTIKGAGDVQGMRVLVRADFNVPVEDGEITDDTRIRETLPTIEYLREQGGIVILCAHLGRPKGEAKDEFRLDPVADKLSELLGAQVTKLDDCVGDEIKQEVSGRARGDVVLLENTRFYPGEKENDEVLARELAEVAELYVNDAFGAAHRAHASTEGVAHHLPAYAGLLMAREIEQLARVRDNPADPFMVVLGGAKISDKIGVIERFIDQADAALIGGGMANTFLKAKGVDVGESLVEDESVSEAERLLEKAAGKLMLPVDAVVADAFEADAECRTVPVDEGPDGWRILDVGPETMKLFEEKLRKARTVIWNGPLGAFELKPFAEGTRMMVGILASLDGTTIVVGGETVSALMQAGVTDQVTHVSTGGGLSSSSWKARSCREYGSFKKKLRMHDGGFD